jgi:hypothetical protein
MSELSSPPITLAVLALTDATNETCDGTAKKAENHATSNNSKGFHEFVSFVAHMKAHEKCYIWIPILSMVHELCPNWPAAFCD